MAARNRDQAPTGGKRPRGANPSKAPVPIGMVVGLGNPGDEYAETRHNAGFQVVDLLAERWGAGYWKQDAGALVTPCTIEGQAVLLAKPQSFMNTSGGPVSKLAREHRVRPEGILVVHDMLDIPAGAVKFKAGGGLDGHNGLRSIADKLKTRDFKRVEVGIGRPPGRMDPADFVLRTLKGKFLEEFDLTVADAADLVERELRRQGQA
ncbi:aminoacyl-tRNA hydrolase [Caniella muris]|uniref:aminoacyl-tRNA hydrolase n=1 Tax=Caniella muris TaxID=2941502 RepID=UPI00308414C1